jgi:isoleucyl-tRNA synthetase
MRAGLAKREPEMLKHWEELDVYNELLKKNSGKPLFNLHDGPPFSNGALHMGHALNKALKDFITRSYAMRGWYTPYIPGWDNHGMPIESAIIKQNKLDRKAMSVPSSVPPATSSPSITSTSSGRLQAHGRHRRLGASLPDHGPRL